MNKRGLPLKRSVVYTAFFGMRIEPELRIRADKLKDKGVDTAELGRQAFREAIARAEEQLEVKAA